MTGVLHELGSLAELPGSDVVLAGLSDVARGAPTAEAALVQVMTLRFAQHGVSIPRLPEDAELVLYRRLGERMGPDAEVYGRYNALLADLVSFMGALDQRRALYAARERRGVIPIDVKSMRR